MVVIYITIISIPTNTENPGIGLKLRAIMKSGYADRLPHYIGLWCSSIQEESSSLLVDVASFPCRLLPSFFSRQNAGEEPGNEARLMY